MKKSLLGFTSKLLKRKKLLLGLIVVFIFGFFLLRKYLFPSKDGFEEGRIEKGTVREELILSGEIKAEEHAKLSFLSSGELDLVSVTEGEAVKKGQNLARLDTTILYQAYLSADADLRRYDASKDKTYDDVQGHKSDETYAQIETRTITETNRDKAYNAYVAAQKNLANATLRAPFDGIVTSITHPFTGVNTSLTESQIELVNRDTIYFEVSADQSEVMEISQGQKVIVVLDSLSDKEYEGKVDYVSLTPKAGEVGAVYRVKVVLSENLEDADNFRIGMTGDAKFILSQNEDVLFVPTRFINSDLNGRFVNLGKTNNKVYIETGLEGEERTEVKGDIKEGDTVYD